MSTLREARGRCLIRPVSRAKKGGGSECLRARVSEGERRYDKGVRY